MVNTVVLLTACVNPGGMTLTALQDPNIRIKQYIDSIIFYLNLLKCKIVVVENTNFDLNKVLNLDKYKERIEYLTFDGNSFNKLLGKGFGEAILVEYALRNSKFLCVADSIIKISGRYILLNIKELFQEIKNRDTVYVNNSRIKNVYLCDSRFFSAPYSFYTDFFLKYKSHINDSKGVYFEHVLFQAKCNWINCGKRSCEFRCPFIFKGITGSTGKQIQNGKFPYLRSLIKFYLHKIGWMENR